MHMACVRRLKLAEVSIQGFIVVTCGNFDSQVLGISSYLPQKERETAAKEKTAEAVEAPPPVKDENTAPTTEDKDKDAGGGKKDEEDDTNKDSDDVERILEGIGESDREMLTVSLSPRMGVAFDHVMSCDCTQTLTEVFMCPLAVLRAMYDDVDGDMSRFLASTEQ